MHAIGRVAKIPVKVPTVSELSENLATSHINEGSNSVKDQRLHVLIIDADAGDSRYARISVGPSFGGIFNES